MMVEHVTAVSASRYSLRSCSPLSLLAWERFPLMERAAVDVARGLQDTSKAAELDRAYKKLKDTG